LGRRKWRTYQKSKNVHNALRGGGITSQKQLLFLLSVFHHLKLKIGS